MTNNKQQTAVEWYAKQIEILHYDYFTEHISKDEKNQRLKQLKEQAKEMEKEQTINFTEDWYFNGPLLGEGIDVKNTIEQHFNKTYGGGEQ
jgi:hypothetical protein